MLALVIASVLLLAGAVLLTVGAETFVEHVTGAASRLGVSVLAVGVLLAGAEPEEAVTAMLAAGQGHPALAMGDPIGANLVVLTLVLGLAASLSPLPVSRRVVEYAAAAAAVGALAVVLAWNGVLSRGEGTLLLAFYVGGVAWVWRRERTPPVVGELADLEPARADEKEPSRDLLLVLLGLLGMVAGGFLAVRGAERLVDVLGVTESVVGLTILALATSAEMLVLVVAARRRDITEVAVAGVVGAVAYNASVSLGLAAWVQPLAIGLGSPLVVVGVLTALLPLVLLTGRRTGFLPRLLGPVLVVGYLAAVGWLFAG